MNSYMQAAIEEAQIGRTEGGIPIGSVLLHPDDDRFYCRTAETVE